MDLWHRFNMDLTVSARLNNLTGYICERSSCSADILSYFLPTERPAEVIDRLRRASKLHDSFYM